ncbi:MAG: hypothetical protein HYV02_01715 [Deltaproteobacteria bacterium]|nr:hypothetical protein [Deltaproteobacteria bacterium]
MLLCGGLAHLILATYETLVEAGYDPTVAYYTAVTEPANLAKLYAEHGLDGAFAQISTTARYGALTRGPRVIDERVRQTLRRILSEIRSGAFATECAAHPAMPASPWANHLIAHPPSTQEPSS